MEGEFYLIAPTLKHTTNQKFSPLNEMKNELENLNNVLKVSKFTFFFRNNALFALYHAINMHLIYGNKNLVKIIKCFSQISSINCVLEKFQSEQREDVLSIITTLKNKGFLISHKMDESAVFEDFKQKLPQPSIVTLRLLITTKCNFFCKYCQIEQNLDASNERLHMDIPVAKKAVQLFASLCPPNGIKTIILTGGEPTLNISLIKYIIEHKNIIPGSTRIVLFTNGSSVSEEFARFLANQNVNILVSIDGPDKIHNKMRVPSSGKSTFETIIKQYQLYKNMGCNVGISAVITPESFSISDYKFAKFFCDLNPISIGFNFPHYLIKSKSVSQINMERYVNRLFYLYKKLRKYGIFTEQISRILIPLITEKPRIRGCAAQGQGITVDPRGYVGHCKSFLISDMLDNKKIVNTKDMPDNKFFYKWSTRSPFFMTNCQNCYAISVCGGGCANDSWCLYKDIWQVDPRTCIFSKHLIKALIWDIYENACSDSLIDFFNFATIDKKKLAKNYLEYTGDGYNLKSSAGH